PDPLEQRRRGFWSHKRGRAAAEEDTRDLPPGRRLGRVVELGEQGPPPARVIDRRADMAVEVAIGALRQEEGPVNVDAEAGIGCGHGLNMEARAGRSHLRLRR